MTGKYKKIFELQHNLYSEGCPAVICAGALTLDNQHGNVIAQLRIRNISYKNIISVNVEIQPYNITGDVLGAPIVYSYLDLNCERGRDFGGKTPIDVPDNTARSFKVKLTQIVYDDNSVEEFNGDFEPIPDSRKLDEKYSGNQVLQFLQLGNKKCQYVPFEYKDLRICSCGCILHSDEKVCYSCNADFDLLLNADDTELENGGIYLRASRALSRAEKMQVSNLPETALSVECAFYSLIKWEPGVSKLTHSIYQVQAVYIEAQELFRSILEWNDSEEKFKYCDTKIEELAKKKKTWYSVMEAMAKKLRTGAMIVAAAIALMIIISIFNKNLIQPLSQYNDALDYAESGNYDMAYSILYELGDFKDSDEKIKEIKNKQAQEYISNGNYDAGYRILKEIGNNNAIYDNKVSRGKKLIELKEYEEAYELLDFPYPPAQEEIKKSKYTRAKEHLIAEEYDEALELLDELSGVSAYKNSKELADKTRYKLGKKYLAEEKYTSAYKMLKECIDYADANKILSDNCYSRAEKANEEGKYAEAASLYENVDTSLYPDADEKRERTSLLGDAKKQYEWGNYKRALEICDKLKGEPVADEIAKNCRAYMKKVEAYCGTYRMKYYGKNLEIEVSYNYGTGKMDFSNNMSQSYRNGSAEFDINNPGKKLIYKSYGDVDCYYYQFKGNGKLVNQLHDTSSADVFTKVK